MSEQHLNSTTAKITEIKADTAVNNSADYATKQSQSATINSATTNKNSVNPTPAPPVAPKSPRNGLKLLLMLSLVIILFYLSLILGTKTFSWSQIWEIIADTKNPDYFTLVEYRMPRGILAVFVGAGFAIGGVMIQSTLHNSLASGETLGINNAAGLFSVLALVFVPTNAAIYLPFYALAGGIFSFIMIWTIIRKKIQIYSIVVIGVALATLYASITNFVLISFPIEISGAMIWLTGSLWGRTWEVIYLYLPWLLIAIPLAFLFVKVLDLFPLGDARVQNLGYRVKTWRIIILLFATLITSFAVAITGPISFLGLVAPHIARKVCGTRHLVLLTASALIGAILLQSADILSRVIKPPVEFPTGMLTSIIGAPYFFYLLIKTRR